MESDSDHSCKVLERKKIFDVVERLIQPFGFSVFGWFPLEGAAGLLIGNEGNRLADAFLSSPFLHDGKPDPLDRYTRHHLEQVALETNSYVRLPFGDVVWPFQRYAQSAMGVKPSPLGILVHPEFGLWFALRGALVFDGMTVEGRAPVQHPCDTCSGKPCLSSCPVGAFTPSGYDVALCRSHVGSAAGSDCRSGGCLARRVCPIGSGCAYGDALQHFHMAAFAGS